MDAGIEDRIHELLAGQVSREAEKPCRIELSGVSLMEWRVDRVVIVLNSDTNESP